MPHPRTLLILAALAIATISAQPARAAFVLPPLPYAEDALVPVISSKTVSVHYGRHQRGYVAKVNVLVEGEPERSLDDILLVSSGTLFDNAAQAWNHRFYWDSLTPKGGGEPSGALAEAIRKDFGSYAEFRKQFRQAAASLFGSGWAWLATDGDKLVVMATQNADNPLRHGWTPLLTVDVWEHAYYLDHLNERTRYVDGVLDRLVNWTFAEANFARQPKAR